MNYENQILISKKALKELKIIPESDRKDIKDRISKLAYFPFAHLDVKKLKGHQNFYRPDLETTGSYLNSKDEKVIKILKILK